MFLLALHNHFSKFKLQTTSKWKWCLNRLHRSTYMHDVILHMVWCMCLITKSGHENITQQTLIFTWSPSLGRIDFFALGCLWRLPSLFWVFGLHRLAIHCMIAEFLVSNRKKCVLRRIRVSIFMLYLNEYISASVTYDSIAVCKICHILYFLTCVS